MCSLMELYVRDTQHARVPWPHPPSCSHVSATDMVGVETELCLFICFVI